MRHRPEQGRIARLRELMDRAGMDSLLVTRREDVRYLTGFTGSAGSLLVARDAKPCLITDFRYKLQSRRESSGAAIIIQKKDFFSALRDAAGRLGITTVWVDESSTSLEGLKKLRRTGLRVRSSSDLIKTLRQLKDRTELLSIRKAIARAEEAFRALQPAIRPGATEHELAIKLEFLMRETGARRAAFDTIVASGGNGAMPHAVTTGRRIRKGDLVTFDFGAEADGYFSDITRTYCMGSPSRRQREIHALVLIAQQAAIASVSIQASCKAVDGTARGIIGSAGHAGHFGHGTGHGVGLMVHEGPSLSPLSSDRISAGMIFTVEPGIYIPGWGGVRIEDMVHATDAGPKVLTTLPRELDGMDRL